MRPVDGCNFLIGGARSGKSDLAVQLGVAWSGDVVMIATASAGDEDMAQRIERHRHDRPDNWALIESPLCTASDITSVVEPALLIIDCITMLVANLMFAQRDEPEIDAHITMLADTLARREHPSIVISNEVGMGVHPETELGRQYRDVLGRANKRIADQAQQTLFVSGGQVAPLQPLTIEWRSAGESA